LHFRAEWLRQIGSARRLVLMRVEGDGMAPHSMRTVIMIRRGKRERRPAQGGGIEIIGDTPRYGEEVF